MRKKYIWMKIDLHDEEAPPIAIADTAGQLAIKLGVKATSIYETVSRAKRKGHRCCYIKMEDDEE